MKDKVFGVLQRVGRSFMLPIAILPVAGLLLGIGGSFTNETMLKTYGLWNMMGPGTVLHSIFQVMREAGNIVFANLPILFAMGVAIGMAKKEKEVAALAAAIAFFIMHASIGALIQLHGGPEAMLEGAVTDVVGITSLQMGVFGGILTGLGVAYLHNRFYRTELPQVLSFFGGTRFVPIISALVYTVVGILMFYVWPVIQSWIYAVGNVVLKSGYFGTWVYGLMERLLIPFGLHHVFYLPFWQTAVGGTMLVNGRMVEGAQNIFFAQLADPSTQQFAVSATRFMSGKFPLMIFGLPGAALAMYSTAMPEKKKAAAGLLASAAFTSMLTGITEPLEFTFLFVAPVLYGIHCVLSGTAYMLMHMLGVGVGMTFSGGLIDLFLFGILQGNAKTGWVWIPAVGIVYFALYYLVFASLIRRMDLKTPGREADAQVKLYRREDMQSSGDGKDEPGYGPDSESDDRSPDGPEYSGKYRNQKQGSGCSSRPGRICLGLGGRQNISDVDCCATRLRCTVFDGALVDDEILRATGASGVIRRGDGVQIIYGPQVTVIKSELEDYLEHAQHDGDPDREREKENGREITEEKEKQREEQREEQREVQRKEQKDDPEKVWTHGARELKVMECVTVSSPMTGYAADIETAPDEAFAAKMMGDGVVVTPEESMVRAPEDGEVVFVFDTKHAVGFRTDGGISMIIHVGIDTVQLEGQGFDIYVTNSQRVRKGDPIMRLDLKYLREHAPSLVSPIVCTELTENQRIRRLAHGSVKAGEPLFCVETMG